MAKTNQEIIDAIAAFIETRGGRYPDWCVGIAADARVRMFAEHKVREDTDWFVVEPADSPAAAREIETHFVKTLGAANRPSSDPSADSVYAYKKMPHTEP